MIPITQLADYISSTKKAVIFDMDGTMVHNLPYHIKAWHLFAQQQGIAVSHEELSAGLAGTATEYLAQLLQLDSHSQLKSLEDEKEKIYRDLYQGHVAEVAGLSPFMQWLKTQSKQIGLATLGNPANVHFTLSNLGVQHYFNDIKHGDDIVRGKPDPEIYIKSLASLGISPQDAIVFEDSKGGIIAAKAAGIEVVGMETVNPKSKLVDWGVIATTPNYLFV